MAKKNPVRTQMPAMSTELSPSVGAKMNRNVPPFDRPKSMGNGGIPEKFFEGYGEKEAAKVMTGTTPTRAPGLTAPSPQGPTRPTGRRRE